MALIILVPDLVLNQDQSPGKTNFNRAFEQLQSQNRNEWACLFKGPVPVAVPADTNHALVPVLTVAALGAVLAAGADEGATAALPCQIAAGTLATGYVLTFKRNIQGTPCQLKSFLLVLLGHINL